MIQAAYEILVTLLVCDGEYDDAEARTIAEFLADNHDGSFEPSDSNQRLMAMSPTEIEAHFDLAADQVKASSTVQDREAILEFGIDLIMGDNELSEDENRLVRRLAERWEVPLQPIVARAMGVA